MLSIKPHWYSMLVLYSATMDWLQSFITERTQQIIGESEKSDVFACASRLGSWQQCFLVCTCLQLAMSSLNTTFIIISMQKTCIRLVNPIYFGNVSRTGSCAYDVSRWVTENVLVPNHTKTEGHKASTSHAVRWRHPTTRSDAWLYPLFWQTRYKRHSLLSISNTCAASHTSTLDT